MKELYTSNDAVYSLTKYHARHLFLDFLDVALTGGAVGGTHDVNDSIRFTHYVIITDIGATLVSFEHNNIMSTLDIDAWDESWLTNFRKFKLDNSIYCKVERVQ